jgi:hypothetical protein
VCSVADLVFIASGPTTSDEVDDAFRKEAATARYDRILGVSEDPLVSADIVGDPHAAIVDLARGRRAARPLTARRRASRARARLGRGLDLGFTGPRDHDDRAGGISDEGAGDAADEDPAYGTVAPRARHQQVQLG